MKKKGVQIDYYNKGKNVFTFFIDTLNSYSIRRIEFPLILNNCFFPSINFYKNQAVSSFKPSIKKWYDPLTEYEYYSNGETKRLRLTNQFEDTLIKLKYENGFPKIKLKFTFPESKFYDSIMSIQPRLFCYFNFVNIQGVCKNYNEIGVYNEGV